MSEEFTTIQKWIFRILFILAVIYHIWSFSNYGLEGFKLIQIGEFQTQTFLFRFLEVLLVIGGNILNYGFRLGFPIWFFYRGWIKK